MHSIGPIERITGIVHVLQKSGLMNTLEIFHIYNTTRLNKQINEKCTAKPNVFFDTIIRNSTDRGQRHALKTLCKPRTRLSLRSSDKTQTQRTPKL